MKAHQQNAFDLVSHRALGGGAFAFKSEYPAYLISLLPNRNVRTEINIVIQPNNSPHSGTLCSLGLTFVVTCRTRALGAETMVSCDLWDRTRAEQETRNGVVYQKSLRDTGRFQEYLPDYQELLEALSQRYDMPYRLRLEEESMDNPEIPGVLQDIIRNWSLLGPTLASSTGAIAVRAACPDCGRVDKYGAKNNYAEDGTGVSFECPDHGRFSFSTLCDVQIFQFNCQTFNLVMGLFYERVPFNYIEICGSDYAGFWQEQLLLRFLSNPILIVYTPLIVDWSGLKASKSLYLQDTAYDYLSRAGQEYLLD